MLAAFGAFTPKMVRGSLIDPAGHDPMTIEEAQFYADHRGAWKVRQDEWGPIPDVLRRLQREGMGYVPAPKEPVVVETKKPSRFQRIVAATKTFTGRRTRDGRPWVRYLRKHASMPDITTDERDEAYKRASA